MTRSDVDDQARSATPSATLPDGPDAETIDRVMAIFVEFRRSLGALRCAASRDEPRSGISMTHVHVLTLLEHHGQMPMSRLAEMLDVSLSNATGLVDRMEQQGLVERIRDQGDRRVVHVRSAPRGQEALHEVQLMRDDLMRRLVLRLGPDEIGRFESVLSDLREAVEAEAREAFGGRDHGHRHGALELRP